LRKGGQRAAGVAINPGQQRASELALETNRDERCAQEAIDVLTRKMENRRP
jgi:hypothetical protein